ncbi:MAG: glycosyltransferase [Candidatus Helarchaeota archaeon]
MIGESKKLKGGISSVVNIYFNSNLIKECNINYQSSYSGKNVFINFFKAILIFIYFLSFKNVDIVHLHSASYGSFYRKSIFVLISRFFRKKIIFHIHSGKFYEFYFVESDNLQKFYIRKILCFTTIIIVVSKQIKESIKRIIKCKKEIKLLQNPVDFKLFNKKKYLSFNANNINILFMGRLEKDKGIYDLINVAEKLISNYQNIRFTFCGDGEVMKIKAIVERKRIKKYFEIPGCIIKKEKYFKDADIFVLPSYYEGVPISILEAASYSLPVVATKVGGIPEIIKDGESGFLVTPGDIEGLKNKILKLARSKSLRFKMGNIHHEIVKNKFDIDIISKQLISIYQSLVLNK